MKRREQISAWIMLSVFVPMLLLSSLHIHTIPSVPINCDECVEHVHHAGHITQYDDPVDDCVLCRFLNQRYVCAFQHLELQADAAVIAVVVMPEVEAIVDAYYGVASLRAPPSRL